MLSLRLSKKTTFDEVGSIVAELAAYNHLDTNKASGEIIGELINAEALIVSGGLSTFDNNNKIYSGCCCGLESWDEWLSVSPEHISLWLGHDPSPYVEFKSENRIYRVWSDGGMNEQVTENYYIDFTPDEFKKALDDVSRDLKDFTILLKQWAQEIDPKQAEKLIETFKKNFHIE